MAAHPIPRGEGSVAAQPRAEAAAPAPALAARGPQPTAAPVVKRAGEMSRFRVPAEELHNGVRRAEQDGADPIVLGPFCGSAEEDVKELQRLIVGKSEPEVRRAVKKWQEEQHKRAQLARRSVAPTTEGDSSPLRPSKREKERRRMVDQWGDLLEQRDLAAAAAQSSSSSSLEALMKRDVAAVGGGNEALDSHLWPRRAGGPSSEPLSSAEQWEDLKKRQTSEEQRCFVGNDQLSCYPTSGLRVPQNKWSKLIWNTNYPEFTNNGGFVDVYLFHQDSDRIQQSWTSLKNAEGRLSFQPTDSWWEDRIQAENFNGTDIPWPFYFVVTYAGEGLGGSTTRLSTWYAVQTALPTAIAAARASESAASLSSASAASLSASLASVSATAAATSLDAAASSSFAASLSSALVSSLRSQGFSGTETLQGTATTTLSDGSVITVSATSRANGNLVNGASDGSGGGLPTYAIVLIAVFGALALIAAIVAAYFLMAAARRRRNAAAGSAYADSDRQLMGAEGGPGSSTRASEADGLGGGSSSDGGMQELGNSVGASLAAAGGGAAAAASAGRRSGTSERSPFTTDEASRMADAFRAALRKPEFASGALLGSAAGAEDDSPPELETGSPNNDARALLREELAASGTDIRTVDERRKPALSGGN